MRGQKIYFLIKKQWGTGEDKLRKNMEGWGYALKEAGKLLKEKKRKSTGKGFVKVTKGRKKEQKKSSTPWGLRGNRMRATEGRTKEAKKIGHGRKGTS